MQYAVLQFIIFQNINNFRCRKHCSEIAVHVVVHVKIIFLCGFAFRGSTVAVFTILVEQYQPSLKRDPCYNEVQYPQLNIRIKPCGRYFVALV